MSFEFSITQDERSYLRELAKKQLEYASLPIMKEKEKFWYEHNSLKAQRPAIVMEINTFIDDILPALKCESEAARDIEKNLLFHVTNHELVGDDKVVPPYYTVYWKISIKEFNINVERKYAKDDSGRLLGYSEEHPIKDLKRDLPSLQHSVYSVDREGTYAWKAFVEEVLGDILPVRIKNNSLYWHAAPSMKVVKLMGLENMMYSIADYPDEMHRLYEFLREDILAFIRWQEEEGLLVANNGNDYTGAGSYGYTTELPREGKDGSRITSRDLWGNFNSQETVGISPAMYGEFIFPYYRDLAENFGLTYYGCCEPVHDIWTDYLSKLPHLRKVSVSPWSNEAFMGEALKGSGVIYSRKPSPNFIGVGNVFDEEAFAKHMENTLKCAKGCSLEVIFRDIYTLSGDRSKPGRAVAILRELIDKMW